MALEFVNERFPGVKLDRETQDAWLSETGGVNGSTDSLSLTGGAVRLTRLDYEMLLKQTPEARSTCAEAGSHRRAMPDKRKKAANALREQQEGTGELHRQAREAQRQAEREWLQRNVETKLANERKFNESMQRNDTASSAPLIPQEESDQPKVQVHDPTKATHSRSLPNNLAQSKRNEREAAERRRRGEADRAARRTAERVSRFSAEELQKRCQASFVSLKRTKPNSHT